MEKFKLTGEARDQPYGGRRIGQAPPGAHQNPDGSWDWDPAGASPTAPGTPGTPPAPGGGDPASAPGGGGGSMAALGRIGSGQSEGYGTEPATPLATGQGQRMLPASSLALAILAGRRGGIY